jgi:uncharacterized protein (TIGR02246 family)
VEDTAATATATDATRDEDQIRARVGEYEAAYNNADGAGIGALYLADGDYAALDGVVTHGRAAVGELWQNRFASDRSGSRASIRVASVRLVRPDVAIVDGAFTIEMMKSEDGAALPPMNGMYTGVYVKQGGQWLIHSLRTMLPVKAKATSG